MANPRKRQRRSRAGVLLRAMLGALLIVAVLVGAVYLTHAGAGFLHALFPEGTEQPETPDNPPLEENRLNLDAFYSENGFLHYPGASIGVDVSSHQGEIDWNAVAGAGVSFAILRVGYRGYTDGDIMEDARFSENLTGAQNAGLDTGVYFFSQAVTPQEAREEAAFVLEQLRGKTITEPVFYDWEGVVEEGSRTAQIDADTMTQCALAFCEAIAAAGYRTGIYFNQSYGYQKYNLITLQPYLFWLAEYADAPSFRYAVDYWQYSENGTVAGISERVDLNLRFDRDK